MSQLQTSEDVAPAAAPPEIEDPHLDPAMPNEAPESSHDEALVETARGWRLAEALKRLLAQVNGDHPGRSKASDGTIGDRAHQSRPSDHNPRIIDGAFGVVAALDITHDPVQCDAGRIVAALHASRDPRIKYIIWNRRIANAAPIGSAPAWAWRAYTGSNPHSKHCHISVKAAKALYDDRRDWALPGQGGVEAAGLEMEEREEDAESLIRAALAALAGEADRPLIEQLVEAQDAIASLLARNAEEARVRAEDEAEPEAPPSLSQLRQGYIDLWAIAQIDPARAGAVAWHRAKLLNGRQRYLEVEARTGAPWWFVGIVHALEASFNFAGHLHNGDPLTARTVQVPRGRPSQWNPPSDWVSSAVDAIAHDGHANLADWGVAETLYRFERYNGFGYRSKGIHSPYLWSFSNHYRRGKYVADGRYDPNAVSKQCGAAAMLKALTTAGDVAL